MTLPGLLSELQRLDVRLAADGDRLRCQAPTGTLTPALLAELQRRKSELLAFLAAARAVAGQPAIIPLQPHGTGPAVFGVAGHNGDVFAYLEMARALGADQPFFGLEPPGLTAGSRFLPRVEDLASYFADQIAALSPRGPQILAGYCAGGTIAFELARQLYQRGVEVGFVAMFGCPYPHAYRRLPRMARRVRTHLDALASLATISDRGHYVLEFARRRVRRRPPPDDPRPAGHDPVLTRRLALEAVTLDAVCRYTPSQIPVSLHVFLPNRRWFAGYQIHRWRAVAGEVREHVGPDDCQMETMLRAPYRDVFASFFRDARGTLIAGQPIGRVPAA